MTHRIGRLRRLDIAAVSVKVLPMGNVSCERGLGIELTVDTAVTTVDSATSPQCLEVTKVYLRLLALVRRKSE